MKKLGLLSLLSVGLFALSACSTPLSSAEFAQLKKDFSRPVEEKLTEDDIVNEFFEKYPSFSVKSHNVQDEHFMNEQANQNGEKVYRERSSEIDVDFINYKITNNFKTKTKSTLNKESQETKEDVTTSLYVEGNSIINVYKDNKTGNTNKTVKKFASNEEAKSVLKAVYTISEPNFTLMDSDLAIVLSHMTMNVPFFVKVLNKDGNLGAGNSVEFVKKGNLMGMKYKSNIEEQGGYNKGESEMYFKDIFLFDFHNVSEASITGRFLNKYETSFKITL